MQRFHQVELDGSEAPLSALIRSLEVTMKVEQPSLGRIGVDSFTLACDWHWEGGWTLRTSTRLSGSQVWTQHAYEALSDDELAQALQEVAAEALGLL